MDSCVHYVIIFVNAAKANLGILMKTSQPYATICTTDVISSNFMTVDMHRFALMWLVYSRNKFFRVVKMFQKNSFRGEPILGGSKLHVTDNRMCVCVCGERVGREGRECSKLFCYARVS